MIEHVAVVASHKQVELAIVIVVSHGNTHAPAPPGQAGLLGDVFERAIRLLVIKSHHRIATLAQSIYRRAIHEDNVQPVVVVAVKQASAATGRINHVMRFRCGYMRYRKTNFFGNVLKSWDWGKSSPIFLD